MTLVSQEAIQESFYHLDDFLTINALFLNREHGFVSILTRMGHTTQKSYLPIVDLSSKCLSLHGEPCYRPELEVTKALQYLGISNASTKPTQKNDQTHARWCSVHQGKCNCHLHNHWKPASMRVRVECTRAHLKPILEMASQFQSHGGSEITNDILDCIEPQSDIEIRDRSILFAYPCIKTQWNYGLGEKSLIRARTPLQKRSRELDDEHLEDQMDELRLKRAELQEKKVEVVHSKNEYYENEYHAILEWVEPKEDAEEEQRVISSPGLITLSDPILFKPFVEPPETQPIPDLIQESTSNINIKLGSRHSTPQQSTIISRKSTPMIEAFPMIPSSRTETPKTKQKGPEIKKAIFGIQALKPMQPKEYQPVLKPLKSSTPYRKPIQRVYPYKGRPVFASQNQFGLYNFRRKPILKREFTLYDVARLDILDAYIPKEDPAELEA
jgi:hypothetical protein